MFESQTIAAPVHALSKADGAPKFRSRAKPLTRVDKRSVLGKRVIELQAVFTAALRFPNIGTFRLNVWSRWWQRFKPNLLRG